MLILPIDLADLNEDAQDETVFVAVYYNIADDVSRVEEHAELPEKQELLDDAEEGEVLVAVIQVIAD